MGPLGRGDRDFHSHGFCHGGVVGGLNELPLLRAMHLCFAFAGAASLLLSD